MVRQLSFALTLLLMMTACGADSGIVTYTTWRLTPVGDTGIWLDTPVDASVHEFGSSVIVFLRPVFKPLFADWQYAIDMHVERLPRVKFEALAATGNAQPQWMSTEHTQLGTYIYGRAKYYRLDKQCSALEVLTATARLDLSARDVSADQLARDDYAIRRILASAKCVRSPSRARNSE